MRGKKQTKNTSAFALQSSVLSGSLFLTAVLLDLSCSMEAIRIGNYGAVMTIKHGGRT